LTRAEASIIKETKVHLNVRQQKLSIIFVWFTRQMLPVEMQLMAPIASHLGKGSL
jgi:hypothetical protein